MVPAVACQDCISRMGVNGSFWCPYDRVHVGEAHVDLALQLLRLNMLRVARDFGGKSALSATAKYQRIASFVIL